MLDFICTGPVNLLGARRERQNTKLNFLDHSGTREFDALPTELAGLGVNCLFK